MKLPACRYVDPNRTVAPSTALEKAAAGEEKSTPVQKYVLGAHGAIDFAVRDKQSWSVPNY
jgi:hypothetical protein